MEKEIEVSDYAVCDKCGKKYSTLTRHKCFKAKAKPKKELDPKDLPDMPKGEGHGTDRHSNKGDNANEGEGENEGQGDSQSDGEGDGEGEGSSQGKNQGEGEGEGEGQGEGEGESEAEGEGPKPKSPDPETPPVAVVCTVLKFAALTAQCAKNGMISVILSEDGLFVSGHNGDLFAHATIPWGEFEKRSTLDGEFYVKDVIDSIDDKIGQAPNVDIDEIIAKHKKTDEPTDETDKPAEPEKPALTIPFFVGQRVVDRVGLCGTVTAIDHYNTDSGENDAVMVRWDDGHTYWHYPDTGQFGGDRSGRDEDIVADAKLTLPLTVGQKVRLRGGKFGVVKQPHTVEKNLVLVAKFREPSTTWWADIDTGIFSVGDGKHDYDAVSDA